MLIFLFLGPAAILAGMDQEACAALMTRVAVWRGENDDPAPIKYVFAIYYLFVRFLTCIQVVGQTAHSRHGPLRRVQKGRNHFFPNPRSHQSLPSIYVPFTQRLARSSIR